MLNDITPVILTYNEEPNIGRTLECLRWAKDIVVVDSFSTDATVEIAGRLPQARIFQRVFDSHANQWNFAAFETDIRTPWILALDADYQISDELAQELGGLDPCGPHDAYRASFLYHILGKTLRGALYPPVAVLFRKEKGRFVQDGHTHRLTIEGSIGKLNAPILHDDRKPLAHWLQAQDRYMRLEAEKISKESWYRLSWRNRLRRAPPLAPIAVFLYCFFVKGGARDGRAGLYYALQRMLAEALLGLHLLEREK